MAKILLLAIAVAAAFWLLRHRRRTKHGAPPPPPRAGDMVGCAHCGLHLPREEGVMSGNRYFCSEAHEQEFRGKH